MRLDVATPRQFITAYALHLRRQASRGAAPIYHCCVEPIGRARVVATAIVVELDISAPSTSWNHMLPLPVSPPRTPSVSSVVQAGLYAPPKPYKRNSE